MVSENEPRTTDEEIEHLGDVRWYMGEISKLQNSIGVKGGISDVDARRRLEFLQESFLAVRGIPLSQAAKDCMNPIDRLENTDILEHTELELGQLETAVIGIKGLSVQKKNRWLSIIRRVRDLQSEARKTAVAMWVYVGRTSETNAIFQMADVHLGYFDVWLDDVNSLIMAPPGHGKTTSLRGQILWDICNNPNRRILICYDTDDKAQKEVVLLKSYLNSGRLQALYPGIWVLDRNDNAQNSSKRFTVHRPNMFSREPSIECAGIMSKVNGNGYDEIVIDDPCPETVANQPAERIRINTKFNTVVEERLRDPENSRIRMICTPWHAEDLAGMIQKDCREGRRHGWRIEVDRFAIKEDENGDFISIWPQRYKPEHYRSKRLKLTNNDFARLYRLKCIADAERIVKRLHYYPALGEADPLWRTLPEAKRIQYAEKLREIAKGEIWLSVDPSATAGKTSSNCGVTKFSLTRRGEAFVLDAWEKPGNPLETQDWLVDQIINHGIHRLLIEAQGGMKGMVTLWTAYIRRRLRELNFNWSGSIVDCKTQGKGGGQNIGKTIRLKNSAAYLENGYVKFPGVLRFNEIGNQFWFGPGGNDSILTLTNQIFDYPAGTCDGVDTVTQWISMVESRLPALSDFQRSEIQSNAEYVDPITAMRKLQMQDLRHPKPDVDPTGEDAWNLKLVG